MRLAEAKDDQGVQDGGSLAGKDSSPASSTEFGGGGESVSGMRVFPGFRVMRRLSCRMILPLAVSGMLAWGFPDSDIALLRIISISQQI